MCSSFFPIKAQDVIPEKEMKRQEKENIRCGLNQRSGKKLWHG
jgi:hypothetical protein